MPPPPSLPLGAHDEIAAHRAEQWNPFRPRSRPALRLSFPRNKCHFSIRTLNATLKRIFFRRPASGGRALVHQTATPWSARSTGVPARHLRRSIVGAGKCAVARGGSIFCKIFEPAAALAPPMDIKAGMAGANGMTRSGKKLLRNSGRCCAPHPPCTDLIVPPGHPLPGRDARFDGAHPRTGVYTKSTIDVLYNSYYN
jgi:hypothetical protein